MSELELQYENNRLERELAAAKSEIEPLKNSWNLSVQAFDISESENKRLREALQKIIDYGMAMQPGPNYHVTFNACVTAQAALDGKGGKRE